MSIVTATCAALVATIASAQPGQTVRLTEPCQGSRIVINNVRPAAPGVIVDFNRQWINQLRVANSARLQLRNVNVIVNKAGEHPAAGGAPAYPLSGAASVVEIADSQNIVLSTGAIRGEVIDFVYGIRLHFSTGVVVERMQLQFMRFGMIMRGTNGVIVRQNAFIGTLEGVQIQGGSRNTTIDANTFVNAPWRGIDFHSDAVQTTELGGGAPVAISNLTITNNLVIGDTQGFLLTGMSANNLNRLLVRGNDLRTSYTWCIRADNALSGEVSDNTCAPLTPGQPDVPQIYMHWSNPAVVVTRNSGCRVILAGDAAAGVTPAQQRARAEAAGNRVGEGCP